MQAIAGVIVLFAFYFTFSTAFIVFFQRTFGYRQLIVPLHLFLVALLLLLLLTLLGLLVHSRILRERRTGRIFLSLIPALFFSLVASLYAADYVANRNWGGNVTFRLAMLYIPQFVSLVNALYIPAWWIYVPSAIFFLLAVGAHVLYSGTLTRGLSELFLADRTFSLLRTRRRLLLSASVLAGLMVVSSLFLASTVNSSRQLWHGEPLVGLFKLPPLLDDNSHRAAIAEEDQAERASYPRNIPFERKNVIIIVADALRSDHMQLYGYERPTTPSLMSLAEEGRLRKVEYALSTCSESVCGLLSILASKYFDDFSHYNLKIYDLLQDLGYKVYFIGGGNHTSWYGYRGIIGRSIDFFFDGAASRRYPSDDDRLLFEAIEKVPDSSGVPAFFFLWMMSTHDAGVKFEEYDRYQPSKLNLDDLASGGYNRQTMINRYDNGVLQADSLIKQLLETLKTKGYMENSLVVITADHANALGERGDYGHGEYLYQENIQIPLLILDDPSIEYANLAFAAQVDIAPTVMDRLGLPIPSCWQGRSLLDPDAERYTFHSTSYHGQRKNVNNSRAVIHHAGNALYKYMRWDPDPSGFVREELYDLGADPEERNNLMPNADPRLLQDLRTKMDEAFLGGDNSG